MSKLWKSSRTKNVIYLHQLGTVGSNEKSSLYIINDSWKSVDQLLSLKEVSI